MMSVTLVEKRIDRPAHSRKSGFSARLMLLLASMLVPAAFLCGCAGTVSKQSKAPPGQAPHSVVLTWDASTSTVSGYNIYRSTLIGGTSIRMNSSPIAGLSYSDTTVQSGQTYYYVTTAVDGSGNESVPSNEVTAVIP